MGADGAVHRKANKQTSGCTASEAFPVFIMTPTEALISNCGVEEDAEVGGDAWLATR